MPIASTAPEPVKTVKAARTIGEHFVQYRKENPDTDNRIIAPAFKMNRAAGDPTTTSGLVSTQYSHEVVRKPNPQLGVLDLFGRKPVSEPVYQWNVYGSTTGNVGTTAEGASKNKLTYAYASKTATLQKITGLIKVTEEMFADVPYIVDAINQDLIDDLNANRQYQAIYTLLNTSGIQTDSVSYTDAIDILDAIIDAAADVEDDTGLAADAVVVTPAIWKVIRKAKNDASEYLAGNPFADSRYSALFEMEFIKCADLTDNHILVGNFARGAELVSKADGVGIDSTNSNDVDFEKNLVSIRAEAREILAVKRPAAFMDISVGASGGTA